MSEKQQRRVGPAEASASTLEPDSKPVIDPEIIDRLVGRAGDGVELTDHLGYDRGDPAGRGSGNSRNGKSPKTVHTDVGTARVESPRDRNGSFEPAILPKGQTRLAVSGFNERIIALYARGMTVRDVQAYLEEIYGVEVSPDLISKVTAAVLEKLREWQNRPLERVYAAICNHHVRSTGQSKAAYDAASVR